MKPINIIFLGKPGSGKGTQAEILKEKFSLHLIDTGEILRRLIKEGGPLADNILKTIKQGGLVPIWLVVFCWLKELIKIPPEKGVVFEGSPRQLEEAKILKEALDWLKRKKIKVIYLNISDEEIIKRLSTRRMCPNCLREYSLELNSELKKTKKCPVCHLPLKRRPDDNPRTIKNRLVSFKKDVYPVIRFFKKEGLLIEINAEGPVEEITQKILESL
ncbi:MAG TPA: nucleoside monophosphate kinase [Candidatus Paceibacterota bacterium]|jgi:adenylate kinase|nr:nucleoside monophosphate kinase [Candidatus Paceibacterota bacterium]HRR45568.1 nucleoside monophosphate kinase [Candidatus Paceibacterota bacterium]